MFGKDVFHNPFFYLGEVSNNEPPCSMVTSVSIPVTIENQCTDRLTLEIDMQLNSKFSEKLSIMSGFAIIFYNKMRLLKADR